MQTIELKPDIYWVGVIDWAVRDFHGYIVPSGTTYNSYLIMDRDITLIDTVKEGFAHVFIEDIKNITSPAKIKNIVINHIENDHMGALGRIMELAPEATIYTTGKGKEGMQRFFDISHWKVEVVKSGDVINIGKRTLTFLETPMLHWPDSMFTYVKEDKLLFSQDAFGQHYASTARFDDEFARNASVSELEDATIDYYANILMPFGAQIKAKIKQMGDLGMEVDMIAPDHGIIWRKDPQKALRLYSDMASGKASLRVVVIFDTMWHATEIMTQPIILGIRDEGVDCKVIKLRATPMSVAVKELWKARGFLIGSPTLNNEVFPSVAEFITQLRGLRPKDRIGGAFGSFGWGGGAVKWLYGELERMKLETMGPGLEVQYRPSAEDLEKCYAFGGEFARRVKEFHGKY